MLISVRHRFIFIANTKCASTSLHRALVPFCEIERASGPGRKHVALASVLEEYAFLFESPGYSLDTFFSFGVFRDPIEWAYSWYRYGENRLQLRPPEQTFEEFFRARGKAFSNPKTGETRFQSDKFVGDDGEPLIDYVISYDALSDELSALSERLEIEPTLKQMNVSPRERSVLDISDDLRSELQAHFAPDYAFLKRLPEINGRGIEKLDRIAPSIRRRVRPDP